MTAADTNVPRMPLQRLFVADLALSESLHNWDSCIAAHHSVYSLSLFSLDPNIHQLQCSLLLPNVYILGKL